MSKQVINSFTPNHCMTLGKMHEIYLSMRKTSFTGSIITNSLDGANVLRQLYNDDIGIYESFYILLLNRRNQTVSYAKISQGGIAGTVVDTKIIGKYALDSLASGVILAHNHPSGNLKPSREDISITKKIKEALALFDIKVLDHLILTEYGYFSFSDEGLL